MKKKLIGSIAHFSRADKVLSKETHKPLITIDDIEIR